MLRVFERVLKVEKGRSTFAEVFLLGQCPLLLVVLVSVRLVPSHSPVHLASLPPVRSQIVLVSRIAVVQPCRE